MERDWAMVKLENFSLELAPLQFQPGIDYSAPPPDSDGEYDTDHEEEELFEPEGRMNSPEDRMHSPEDMFDVDESTRGWFQIAEEGFSKVLKIVVIEIQLWCPLTFSCVDQPGWMRGGEGRYYMTLIIVTQKLFPGPVCLWFKRTLQLFKDFSVSSDREKKMYTWMLQTRKAAP
jgi:hypothetical protein